MAGFLVVDVASYQSTANAADPHVKATIVKATQGTGYVNPKCNAQYAAAKAAGKKLGLYHYAGGGDPVAEANYFIANIKNYVGEALLVLDWESGQNRSWGSTTWARSFMNRVHALTGVWPLLYTGSEGAKQCANCKDVCGLWFAGYPYQPGTRVMYRYTPPTKFPYSTAPWPTYTMWQYTSFDGALDISVANFPIENWDKFANPSGAASKPAPAPSKPAPAPSTGYSTSGKSLEQIASDVQAGKVGSGSARQSALGNLYNSVQAIVNERAKVITGAKSHAILASEVKAGRLGNGATRQKLLGSYYGAVQAIINGSSKPAAPAARYYTVKSGDNLSAIGSRLGVSWTSIASKNGLKSPYTIYPGQKLKY